MEWHHYVWCIYTNTTKKISIPCNGCLDNARCPKVNPFLRYVIFTSTLIVFNFMKLIYYAWMFFQITQSFYIIIIANISNPAILYVGLQTKGKFACLVYGPKIKSRHWKSLQKEVFNEHRHFLSNNHRYQTIDKHLFNGKQEIALKSQRMTPHLWKL